MFEVNGWLVMVVVLVILMALLWEGWARARREAQQLRQQLNTVLFGVPSTFEAYSAQAMRTAMPQDNEDAFNHALLGLGSETGELMTHWKAYRYYGKALERAYVKKELGDVLWFLNRATLASGMTLLEVAEANIAKLYKRYPEKYTAEAALARADEGRQA